MAGMTLNATLRTGATLILIIAALALLAMGKGHHGLNQPQRVLAIGDCHTGYDGGTDSPQGRYWWAWFPEILSRPVLVQRASFPGTALANWGGLTSLPTRDLYYLGTLSIVHPIDVVVTMLGGHDIRLGVTPEEFEQAAENFLSRVRHVSGARAWVIVLQGSPNEDQRENLTPLFDIYLRLCDREADVFCTVDLRPHFRFEEGDYGETFHWHRDSHEKAARLIAPTMEQALRFARRRR